MPIAKDVLAKISKDMTDAEVKLKDMADLLDKSRRAGIDIKDMQAKYDGLRKQIRDIKAAFGV